MSIIHWHWRMWSRKSREKSLRPTRKILNQAICWLAWKGENYLFVVRARCHRVRSSYDKWNSQVSGKKLSKYWTWLGRVLLRDWKWHSPMNKLVWLRFSGNGSDNYHKWEIGQSSSCISKLWATLKPIIMNGSGSVIHGKLMESRLGFIATGIFKSLICVTSL